MFTSRSKFGFAILSCLFMTLVLLAWSLEGINLSFLSSAPIVMKFDNTEYPLLIGLMPLSVLLFSCALLLLNILNEFFGKAAAFFLCLAASIGLLVPWGFLKCISWIPMLEEAETLEISLKTAFDLSLYNLSKSLIIIIVGFGILSFFYGGFRSLTHGRFSLIRLVFSAIFGLAFVAAGPITLDIIPVFSSFSKGQFVAAFLTSYPQWLILTFLFIPLFYILKMLFQIIVGTSLTENFKNQFSKKTLFKPEPKDFFEQRQENQEQRI